MSDVYINSMLTKILNHEGGFVNDPDDKGGATKYGVTQKALSKHLGKEATVEDVKKLDIEVAKTIFKEEYYFKAKINFLPPEIQQQVFDCSVNHGAKRAIKFVQHVCNIAEFEPLTVDGANGSNTIKVSHVAQKEMGDWFTNAIADERINFYHSIVAKNPSQRKFLKGWLKRADSFKVEM